KIQQLKRNTSLKVGFSQNLTNLLPCVIPSIKLGFEFIIDKTNKLEGLQKIVNNDYFNAAIGFATGEIAAAKAISNLTQGMIGHFLDGEKQQILLQFNGEFNFFNESIQEGYYLILGSQNRKYPLPSTQLNWTISNHQLQVEGLDLKHYSYLVLKIGRVEARTRYLSLEADWNKKLNEAEDLLKNIDQFGTEAESTINDQWEKCLSHLREAQVLIRNDVNFLPKEANQIIHTSFHHCKNLLEERQNVRSGNQEVILEAAHTSEQAVKGMELLGIAGTVNLQQEVLDYGSAVRRSRRKLKAGNWL
ncbi:MAG: hypothetical protein AAF206_24590, partial [Bacteroidota bacterium]